MIELCNYKLEIDFSKRGAVVKGRCGSKCFSSAVKRTRLKLSATALMAMPTLKNVDDLDKTESAFEIGEYKMIEL